LEDIAGKTRQHGTTTPFRRSRDSQEPIMQFFLLLIAAAFGLVAYFFLLRLKRFECPP